MNIEEYKNTADVIAADLNDSLRTGVRNIIKTSHLSVELLKSQALRKIMGTMHFM